MTAPAPGLPQDVAITLAVYTEAVRENAVIPFTVGHLDSRESALLAALRAAILAAMRAATAGSGEASAVAAASAAHVAPGGEPVAWAVVSEPIGLFSIIFDEGTTQIRYGGKPEADKTAAQLNADEMRGHPFTVAPLFTRPAPPVSASFDAALAALDVEPTHHPDRMVTTYAIVGLDDVRAAHRAEVDRLSARVAKLEAEQSEARNRAARIEAALRFYAEPSGYLLGLRFRPVVVDDGGMRARAALEDKS